MIIGIILDDGSQWKISVTPESDIKSVKEALSNLILKGGYYYLHVRDEKMRQRETEELAQVHSASESWSQKLDSGRLGPDHTLLSLRHMLEPNLSKPVLPQIR